MLAMRSSALRNYFKCPVPDPFGIIDAQENFIAVTLHKYHQKRVGNRKAGGSLIELNEKESFEVEILQKTYEVNMSRHWRRLGTKDSHWDEMSIKAIEYLHSLGFKTNQDIVRYIHFHTLP
jgi:hypothetical protein